MAGRKGRSGRRAGSLSWSKNPTALAGNQLNVYIEEWLGGVPIPTRSGRWLVQPTERRYTVPPKIKGVLALIAIEHVMNLYRNLKRPEVDAVLAWSRRRAPSITLRRPARAKPRDAREAAYHAVGCRLANAWKK